MTPVEVDQEYVERMDREEAHYNNPCRVKVLQVREDTVHVKIINGGLDEAWWPLDCLENTKLWRRAQ